MQTALRDLALALAIAGSIRAASTAMTARTTSSSISVKALHFAGARHRWSFITDELRGFILEVALLASVLRAGPAAQETQKAPPIAFGRLQRKFVRECPH